MEAPISAGDVLGTVTLSYDGTDYATVDLLALNDVEASRILTFWRDVKEFFSDGREGDRHHPAGGGRGAAFVEAGVRPPALPLRPQRKLPQPPGIPGPQKIRHCTDKKRLPDGQSFFF